MWSVLNFEQTLGLCSLPTLASQQRCTLGDRILVPPGCRLKAPDPRAVVSADWPSQSSKHLPQADVSEESLLSLILTSSYSSSMQTVLEMQKEA